MASNGTNADNNNHNNGSKARQDSSAHRALPTVPYTGQLPVGKGPYPVSHYDIIRNSMADLLATQRATHYQQQQQQGDCESLQVPMWPTMASPSNDNASGVDGMVQGTAAQESRQSAQESRAAPPLMQLANTAVAQGKAAYTEPAQPQQLPMSSADTGASVAVTQGKQVSGPPQKQQSHGAVSTQLATTAVADTGASVAVTQGKAVAAPPQKQQSQIAASKELPTTGASAAVAQGKVAYTEPEQPQKSPTSLPNADTGASAVMPQGKAVSAPPQTQESHGAVSTDTAVGQGKVLNASPHVAEAQGKVPNASPHVAEASAIAAKESTKPAGNPILPNGVPRNVPQQQRQVAQQPVTNATEKNGKSNKHPAAATETLSGGSQSTLPPQTDAKATQPAGSSATTARQQDSANVKKSRKDLNGGSLMSAGAAAYEAATQKQATHQPLSTAGTNSEAAQQQDSSSLNRKQVPTADGFNGGSTNDVPIAPQLPNGAQTALPLKPYVAATQKRPANQSVTTAALSATAQQSSAPMQLYTAAWHQVAQQPMRNTMTSAPAQQPMPYALQQNAVGNQAPPGTGLQFMAFIDVSRPSLYNRWRQQLMQSNFLLFIHIDVFILSSPSLEASSFRHVELLRDQWRLQREEASDDTVVVGLCCRGCVAPCCLTSPSGVQFFDPHEEDMYHALLALRRHVATCPCTPVRTRNVLQNALFSPVAPLELRAYVSMFCESTRILHYAQNASLPSFTPQPGRQSQSRQQITNEQNTLERYSERERYAEQEYKDMEDTISQAFHKCKVGKGVIASDMTAVPSSDPLVEFPFFLYLLEHIEIVRITAQSAAEQHRELLREKKVDSLVLFQCRFCHGKSCLGACPYVMYSESPEDFQGLQVGLIKIAYHHTRACPNVPDWRKRKLKRVEPKASDAEFSVFAFFFKSRIIEWMEYVEERLASINRAATIARCEDVGIWLPIPPDKLMQMDGAWSFVMPTERNVAEADEASLDPKFFENDNNVVEGFDGACDLIGNKRYRVLVASLRDEFMLAQSPGERRKVAEQVVDTIRKRGGSFLSLDEHGFFQALSKSYWIERAKNDIKRGFPGLLYPDDTPFSGQGRGSNVLGVEEAPHYDVLSGKVRCSKVSKLSVDYQVAQRVASKRKYQDILAKKVTIAGWSPRKKLKQKYPGRGSKVLEVEAAPTYDASSSNLLFLNPTGVSIAASSAKSPPGNRSVVDLIEKEVIDLE